MKPCYEESLVSIDLTNKKPGVWYTFKNGEWSELRPKLDQVVETKFKEKRFARVRSFLIWIYDNFSNGLRSYR